MIIAGVLGDVAGKQVGKGHGKTSAILVGTLIGFRIIGSIGKSIDDTDIFKKYHAHLKRFERM